jgi:hypothetical protein
MTVSKKVATNDSYLSKKYNFKLFQALAPACIAGSAIKKIAVCKYSIVQGTLSAASDHF